MKIDKAIKILDKSMDFFNGCSKKDEQQAKKLGIEALKRHRDRYKFPQELDKGYLPGETEE